jgi:WD40 repeat protein
LLPYLVPAMLSGSSLLLSTWIFFFSLNTKPPILWSADWSPDNQKIAIGGDDGLLSIYETTNFKISKTYQFPNAIQCLDWNKNGKILAIALDDSPVQLLDLETGKFRKLEVTTGSRALAWNSTGDLLAVGDYEGRIHIWGRDGKLVKSIEKGDSKTYLGVDWHPTKNILLAVGDKIRLFDASSGKLLKAISHRKEQTIILACKWHPAGTFFATGDYGESENNIESLLQFWNEDGTLIKSLKGSKAEYRNIKWNKDGSLLATASDGLRIWSTDGVVKFAAETDDLLWGIDWDSPNKKIVTSSGKGNIYIWSDKGEKLKDIK